MGATDTKVSTDEEPGKKIGESIEKALDELELRLLRNGDAPCLMIRHTLSCVERARRNETSGQRQPMYRWDVDAMCASCAAYWHVCLAHQRVRNARRTGSSHGL
jgi:hypothetical protein